MSYVPVSSGLYLPIADIDDTPVNGETAAPISSNWAYDHVAAADPHTGYRLESADHTHESTGAQAGKLDHGAALNGLTDDDHTQYALLAGRSGGQTIVGGTAASETLTLRATANATDGDIIFQSDSGPTERARIEGSTGDFGIGIANPAYRLHVKDDAASDYAATFQNDAGGANGNINRYGITIAAGEYDGTDAAETTIYVSAATGNLSSQIGRIEEIAAVFTFTEVSDPNLKENIAPTKIVGLDLIKAMEIIEFNWKRKPNGKKIRFGFNAEQMAGVLPECCSAPDVGPLGVGVTRIIPVLVKAVQELSARVEALEGLG